MRGGYLHNRVLIDPLANDFQQAGAVVRREVPVTIGQTIRFADLVVDLDSRRLVVEAELSPRRLANDLAKAKALMAHELWIVVPAGHLQRVVRRALRRLGHPPSESLFVLTQGQSRRRVTNCFLNSSTPIVDGKK